MSKVQKKLYKETDIAQLHCKQKTEKNKESCGMTKQMVNDNGKALPVDRHYKKTDTWALGSADWMYFTQLLRERKENISVRYDFM